MLEIAIMLEGQNGLNWPRWQKLAAAVEDLGFAGLYRSDHFTNADGPVLDSLELWVSLTWLASHTRRIEFGPLVTPFSFRHPAFTARMAGAVDDLSGGRLTLGVGAGWQEREHNHFGFDLLDLPSRFARFEEGLQVVSQLLHSDQPVNFGGAYYQLKEARLMPLPRRPGGPPLLVGGNGARRTLPLAAKYAREWNAVYSPAAEFAANNRRLDELLLAAGRQPADVRRSQMTGCRFGRDQADLNRKLGAETVADLRQRGVVVGTPPQMVDQLGELAQAGAQRVMLQWLDLDDLDGLTALAQTVLPHFKV
jgi:F420-dependent oxidoreductase-like protein